jgi:hypothetical protein
LGNTHVSLSASSGRPSSTTSSQASSTAGSRQAPTARSPGEGGHKSGFAEINLNTTNPPVDVRGVPTLTWNCWPGWDMTGVSFHAFPEYEAWATSAL